jgi:hypothetical protein
MDDIGFTRVRPTLLCVALQSHVIRKIQTYTATVALEQTCHTMHTRRVVSLCAIGRSLGVRWHKYTRFARTCGHGRDDVMALIAVADPRGDRPLTTGPGSLCQWFSQYGYVTTNPVTHSRAVALFLTVVGGHVVLDGRGRTSRACTTARLSRNCRYPQAQQMSHLCDLNCHVSGSYTRDEINDTMGVNRVQPGDTLRIVFIRDDLWNGDQCTTMAAVFKFAIAVKCELAFCASSHLSHVQNMATLMFLIKIGRLAGLWGSPSSQRSVPLPVMTFHAYVVLDKSHISPSLSSRCIMAGSLHFSAGLHAYRQVRLKGVLQSVGVVRVQSLAVVGQFSTVGLNITHRPLIFQCVEIHIIKCLPRVVGMTSRLDKDEVKDTHQCCYFEQTVSASPVVFLITTSWPQGVTVLPLQTTTQYILRVCGSVDLETIPGDLLMGAVSVEHGGVDVIRAHNTSYMHRLSCLTSVSSTTWL